MKVVSNKGQLISKCPFGAIVSTKKTNEIFQRISALGSKNLNQKNISTFLNQLKIISLVTFFISTSFNPIPNRLGHVTYNERADSALTW